MLGQTQRRDHRAVRRRHGDVRKLINGRPAQRLTLAAMRRACVNEYSVYIEKNGFPRVVPR